MSRAGFYTEKRSRRWKQLMKRDPMVCRWCGKEVVRRFVAPGKSPKPDMATMDHVVSRHHGGSDELDNLVIACWPCNKARGNGDINVVLTGSGEPLNPSEPSGSVAKPAPLVNE